MLNISISEIYKEIKQVKENTLTYRTSSNTAENEEIMSELKKLRIEIKSTEHHTLLQQETIEDLRKNMAQIKTAVDKNQQTYTNSETNRDNTEIIKEITELRKEIKSSDRNTTQLTKPNSTSQHKQNETTQEETSEGKTSTQQVEENWETQRTRRSKRKTYAEILNRQNRTKDKQSGEIKTPQEWKTPEKRRNYDTIIHLKNKSQEEIGKLKPKELIAEIRKNIDQDMTNEGLQNIKTTDKGTIILTNKDKEEQDKIVQALSNKGDIEIKTIGGKQPRITITGVLGGYTNEEFRHEFIQQNAIILKDQKTEDIESIKVLTKRACRDSRKENWTLEMNPPIFKLLMHAEIITMDLMRLYVNENNEVSMCFNCCGFNHSAKKCTQPAVCYKCGQGHNARDCRSEEINCANCEKMSYQRRRHTARDTCNKSLFR
ncbi:unnamed protein product [Phaedon cochleariae]|uniref:CCHC-type domain-containing protein n=1 Tax=Phaedon cochleariae TaxID=80249 RepID=A0A9N9X5V6_PHACE|nr:unnamed protein product [Phaedon cochleariae]